MLDKGEFKKFEHAMRELFPEDRRNLLVIK